MWLCVEMHWLHSPAAISSEKEGRYFNLLQMMSETIFRNEEKNLIALAEFLGRLNTKCVAVQNFPASFLLIVVCCYRISSET